MLPVIGISLHQALYSWITLRRASSAFLDIIGCTTFATAAALAAWVGSDILFSKVRSWKEQSYSAACKLRTLVYRSVVLKSVFIVSLMNAQRDKIVSEVPKISCDLDVTRVV